MSVTLTSPVLGKNVGDTYTGTLEDWLLANGYAKRTGYTGPGVSNTGPADVVPAKDPMLASNRGDKPYFPATADRDATMANDAAHLNEKSHRAPGQDFDSGGVDDDTGTGTPTNPTPAAEDFDPANTDGKVNA